MMKPRKPSAVHELSGAFRHNPNRARPDEPVPDGKLSNRVPAHLTPEQKKLWKEAVKLCPPGVITSADPWSLELLVVLMAEFREDPNGMTTPRLGRLHACLRAVGMDPSGRASLVVPTTKANDFDKLEAPGLKKVG